MEHREEMIALLKEISKTDVRKCMKCGKCSARCPMFKQMDLKPHQFVSLLGQGKVERLLESKSIWYCLSCMACVERCPRGVAPQQVIDAVRTTVMTHSGTDELKAEDIPNILDEETPQQLLVSAFRKYKR